MQPSSNLDLSKPKISNLGSKAKDSNRLRHDKADTTTPYADGRNLIGTINEVDESGDFDDDFDSGL
jgi:hypothetical protein